MRRLAVRLGPVAVVLLLSASCKRELPQVETFEAGNELTESVVKVADPKVSKQLLSGFHAVEANSWRWTEGKFSVLLDPPAAAPQKGAKLELRFALPVPAIERLKAVTVSVNVGGAALGPELYTTPGDHVYVKDVPASVFHDVPVTASFSLDRFLKAGEVEPRELGLVVSEIGLLPK